MNSSLIQASLRASLSVLAAAVPFAGFAQENVDKAVEKKVVTYGLLGLNVNVSDSQGSTPLNFENTYGRIGLKVSEGIAVGQLELSPGPTAVSDKAKNELKKVDAIAIRHANAGLKLDTGTKILFGRIRPGGANGYGADATYVPDNYSSMDGVSVFQDLEFGEGIKLNAGLAVTNGLLSLSDTLVSYSNTGGSLGVPGAKNRTFSITRTKSDPALLFGLTANVKGVDFVAYYGTENNQVIADPTKEVKEVKAGDTVITAAAPETFGKVADATHTEVSLGYSGIEGISFGGWYVNYTQGKDKTITKNDGGKLETEVTGKFSYDRTVIGAGVMGDSSLFGLTGLLQTGDKLIYSASYAQTQFAVEGDGVNDEKINETSGETEKSLKKTFEDSSTGQIVVGAGYVVGGLTLELNVASETAGDKYFSSSKGEANKEKTWNRVYLASYYAF